MRRLGIALGVTLLVASGCGSAKGPVADKTQGSPSPQASRSSATTPAATDSPSSSTTGGDVHYSDSQVQAALTTMSELTDYHPSSLCLRHGRYVVLITSTRWSDTTGPSSYRTVSDVTGFVLGTLDSSP